jgi:hypothetical protein
MLGFHETFFNPFRVFLAWLRKPKTVVENLNQQLQVFEAVLPSSGIDDDSILLARPMKQQMSMKLGVFGGGH